MKRFAVKNRRKRVGGDKALNDNDKLQSFLIVQLLKSKNDILKFLTSF